MVLLQVCFGYFDVFRIINQGLKMKVFVLQWCWFNFFDKEVLKDFGMIQLFMGLKVGFYKYNQDLDDVYKSMILFK